MLQIYQHFHIFTFPHLYILIIMLQQIPAYINLSFIILVLISGAYFYFISRRSLFFLVVSVAWLTIQSFLALNGFYYDDPRATPPHFPLLVLPALILIACVFITRVGKNFISRLDLKWLTLFHIIRLPVELILLSLYQQKMLPQLMTFEGRNFDILSGITAPFIFYFGFIKPMLSKKIILIWNFLCLALLINIVVNAVLSLPSSFQQFGFDQPNRAVLYFPFIWLPCYIVPLVLFSHLAAITKLISKN